MLCDGMMALAGAAVVDHARSARRQSKGSGPGLVSFRMRPAVGEMEEPPPPPPRVKCLLAHNPGPAVPRASFLGCPLLSWAALYCCCVDESVPPLLVSVLVRRWRSL